MNLLRRIWTYLKCVLTHQYAFSDVEASGWKDVWGCDILVCTVKCPTCGRTWRETL